MNATLYVQNSALDLDKVCLTLNLSELNKVGIKRAWEVKSKWFCIKVTTQPGNISHSST